MLTLGFSATGRFALGQIPSAATPVISWFAPLSEPVRARPRLNAGEQQFLAFHPNPVVPFSWFAPLSEPVRTRPGTHPSRQQSIAQDTQVIPASLMQSWFAPLSEPVRFRPGLAAARQQFLAAPSRLLPTPTTFGTIAATETKDTMVAGGQFWDRVTQGEIGIAPSASSAGQVAVTELSQPANAGVPSPMITSARLSIRIV